jgi:hypothetical protein
MVMHNAAVAAIATTKAKAITAVIAAAIAEVIAAANCGSPSRCHGGVHCALTTGTAKATAVTIAAVFVVIIATTILATISQPQRRSESVTAEASVAAVAAAAF